MYVDLSTKDGCIAALAAVGSALEDLSDSVDLDDAIETARSASSAAADLRGNIEALQDSTIGSISEDISSAASEAEDIESACDSVVSELENLQ